MPTTHNPTPQVPGFATAPIEVGRADDGSLLYLVDLPPEAMPAVRVRDLLQAWERARDAASARKWSVPRGLRFHRGEGRYTDLALTDRDAACWAGAVDQLIGLNTSYGLSLCLRLLALIDLLASAEWAAPLLALQAGHARLHPDLVRLAATTTLTAEARFDPQRIQHNLGQYATRAVKFTGACQ
jgi:hypothetical protein